jgi:hypothetical protein
MMACRGWAAGQVALVAAECSAEPGEELGHRERLDAGGSRADLLWTLADVEFADGDLIAGKACLAEAFDASGEDAAALARQVRALHGPVKLDIQPEGFSDLRAPV